MAGSVLLASDCGVYVQPLPRRSTKPPSRLDSYVGTATHGSHDSLSNVSDYHTNIYYHVLDCITGDMESRLF